MIEVRILHGGDVFVNLPEELFVTDIFFMEDVVYRSPYHRVPHLRVALEAITQKHEQDNTPHRIGLSEGDCRDPVSPLPDRTKTTT